LVQLRAKVVDRQMGEKGEGGGWGEGKLGGAKGEAKDKLKRSI